MEIKVRDPDVHYEEVGEGRPFIIIHGWTDNGRMFMGVTNPYSKIGLDGGVSILTC